MLLRWGIQRGLIVIPKSSDRERIRENARIFDFSLSDEQMAALDALDRTGGTDRAREQAITAPAPRGAAQPVLKIRGRVSGRSRSACPSRPATPV